MKTTSAVPAFAVTVLIALLAGCIAQPPTPEEQVYTLIAADLTINLTYLDRDTLADRHGKGTITKKYNPYIDYPALLTKKKITVFDFEARTVESTVFFTLNDSTLFIDNKGGTAKSKGYMENLWLAYTEKDEKARMTTTLRSTILPREFIASPGSPAKGYLVFADAFPKGGGMGTVKFVVATAAGDTGVLELPIPFDPAGDVGGYVEAENTGIFTVEDVETAPVDEAGEAGGSDSDSE